MCRESDQIARRRIETERLRRACAERCADINDPSTLKYLPAPSPAIADLTEQLKRIV